MANACWSIKKNSSKILIIEGQVDHKDELIEVVFGDSGTVSCNAYGLKFEVRLRNPSVYLRPFDKIVVRTRGGVVIPFVQAGVRQDGCDASTVTGPISSIRERRSINNLLLDGYRLDKKGYFRREWSAEKIRSTISLYKNLDQALGQVFGYDLRVCFGTLLGFVRSGSILAFDDDFDCCYVSKYSAVEQVMEERYRILGALRDRGFDVYLTAAIGQMRIRKGGCVIDLSPAWLDPERNLFVGPFLMIENGARFSDGFDLVRGYEHRFKAFKESEKFLEHSYGIDWREPRPGWRRELQQEVKKMRPHFRPPEGNPFVRR